MLGPSSDGMPRVARRLQVFLDTGPKTHVGRYDAHGEKTAVLCRRWSDCGRTEITGRMAEFCPFWRFETKRNACKSLRLRKRRAFAPPSGRVGQEVPIVSCARQFDCWVDVGRSECEANDPVAQAMLLDLHNLVPSIGQVNALRSRETGTLGSMDDIQKRPSKDAGPYRRC